MSTEDAAHYGKVRRFRGRSIVKSYLPHLWLTSYPIDLLFQVPSIAAETRYPVGYSPLTLPPRLEHGDVEVSIFSTVFPALLSCPVACKRR